MNKSTELKRKLITGMYLTDKLSQYIKGTVHVAFTGKDARISVADENGEFYSTTYSNLGSFITSSYVLTSDLDLIAEDVINDFTSTIINNFFK